MPVIVSDAGGIPLQVQEGVNGFIVPTADPKAVADKLFDLHQGKIKLSREVPKHAHPSDSAYGQRSESPIQIGNDTGMGDTTDQTDPNSLSDAFVENFSEPVPKVHSDCGATSEDFWTVGNVTRWGYLFTRLLALDEGKDEVLRTMQSGKALEGKGVDGTNVWELVMGQDKVQGEGHLI